MPEFGSISIGPSELYLMLLKREIEPAEYVKRAKKQVQDEQKPPQPRSTGAQLKKA